jgi:hypothetical protein
MSVMLPPPNYPLFPGNTGQFLVTALMPDGVTPFPLTGATVNWQGTLVPGSEIFIFSKSIGTDVVIPTPANGQITCYMRPADTAAIAGGSTIFNYVTVTDSSGNVYTVEKFIVLLGLK